MDRAARINVAHVVASYRELNVWKESVDLAVAVYRVTAKFPRHERFGLCSQAERAAVSIPANIAEGYYRTHRGDYLRFLSVAKGSLAELETHLLIARRLNYGEPMAFEALETKLNSVGKMLTALIKSLYAH